MCLSTNILKVRIQKFPFKAERTFEKWGHELNQLVQNVMVNLNKNEKIWTRCLVSGLFVNTNHVLSLPQSFKGIFTKIFPYYLTMFLALLHTVHMVLTSPQNTSFLLKLPPLIRQFPYILLLRNPPTPPPPLILDPIPHFKSN